MQYFVITQTGQKFGPADIHILSTWVTEGRILPNTMLEDSMTGQQMMANQVAGLGFPAQGNYYQGVQPSTANYARVVDAPGDKLAGTAKALGIAGFFLCPLLSLIGVVYAAMAFTHGSPKAKSAMFVCVGSIVIQLLLLGIMYGSVMSAFSSMG